MSHCSGRTRWLLSATAGLLLAGSAALATEPPQWSTRVTVDPAAVPVTNPGPAIAASPLAPDNFQEQPPVLALREIATSKVRFDRSVKDALMGKFDKEKVTIAAGQTRTLK